MRKIQVFSVLLFLAFLMGCSTTNDPSSNQNTPSAPVTSNTAANLQLVEAYPNLVFNQPLEYRHAFDNSDRVFVVEKAGRILVFQNNPQVQSWQVFLDLTGRVDSNSSEQGLLGLAFHPDYKNNGLFYVNYTARNSTIVARYRVNPGDPNQALSDSEEVILTFNQPFDNHNGGHLSFGPDGYLYIASGDGGLAGDPQNNAQNRGNLLGKILRIDVDKPGNGTAYSIPPDNPFFGNQEGFREEIYAYGLRNPWKFSFDPGRAWLWAADVGQSKIEEIDIIQKGANYGWRKMEGSLPYLAVGSIDQTGLTSPVWEYQHPTGNSITGGYAYYGKLTPSLNGAYIYGDFGTGMIWSLRLDENMKPDNRTLFDTDLNISSFGLDQNNELYVVDYKGKIYKFIES